MESRYSKSSFANQKLSNSRGLFLHIIEFLPDGESVPHVSWGSLVIRLDSYQQPWPYLWSIRNSITFQQTTHLQPKSTLASCTILVQLSYHHPYKTTTRPKHPPSCSSQRVIPWSNRGETLKLFSNVVDWEPACQTPSSYGNRLSDVLDPTRKGTFIISSPPPKKKKQKKRSY